MLGPYLLDTNHLGAAVRRRADIRERVRDAQALGIRVGTCAPVLCEVACGLRFGKNPAADIYRLRQVLQEVRIWALDLDASLVYAEVWNELRLKGRVLSQVDMMLAAMCRVMKLTLLTTDRDFEALPDSRTENWLKVAPDSR